MNLCIMFIMPISATEVMAKENIIENEEVIVASSSNYFGKTLPRLSSTNGTTSRIVTFASGFISGSA